MEQITSNYYYIDNHSLPLHNIRYMCTSIGRCGVDYVVQDSSKCPRNAIKIQVCSALCHLCSFADFVEECSL